MSNWRNSKDWKNIKSKAKNRDNHKCVICGSDYRLEVHHIEDGSYHPELRYKMSNLVTLCRNCHINFHTNFKKSFRQKCTKDDWNNFVQLSNYFLNKAK